MQALHLVILVFDSVFCLHFSFNNSAMQSRVQSPVECPASFRFNFLFFHFHFFFFKFYTTILRICAKTVNKIPRLHLSQVSHRCSINFHLFFQSFLFLFLFMFLGMHDVFKNCQHHSPPPLKSSVLA